MIPEHDLHNLRSLSRAARGGTLDPLRLAEKAYEMGSAACHQASSLPITPPETLNLVALEKFALTRAIEQTHGNVLEAARILGIGKTTAYRKAKQYGLKIGFTPTFCPNCGSRLTYSPTSGAPPFPGAQEIAAELVVH